MRKQISTPFFTFIFFFWILFSPLERKVNLLFRLSNALSLGLFFSFRPANALYWVVYRFFQNLFHNSSMHIIEIEFFKFFSFFSPVSVIPSFVTCLDRNKNTSRRNFANSVCARSLLTGIFWALNGFIAFFFFLMHNSKSIFSLILLTSYFTHNANITLTIF